MQIRELSKLCKNCKWWKVYDFGYTGECRRHGPSMTCSHRKIGWGNGPEDREITSHIGWPDTDAKDTCGEFESGAFPGYEIGETFVMSSDMTVSKVRQW